MEGSWWRSSTSPFLSDTSFSLWLLNPLYEDVIPKGPLTSLEVGTSAFRLLHGVIQELTCSVGEVSWSLNQPTHCPLPSSSKNSLESRPGTQVWGEHVLDGGGEKAQGSPNRWQLKVDMCYASSQERKVNQFSHFLGNKVAVAIYISWDPDFVWILRIVTEVETFLWCP